MDTSPSPWSDLTDTQRAIVVALLRSGRLPRTRLMEIIGISPGSVTRLTTPLIEAGLLSTSTEQTACTGRPQSPLEVRSEAEVIVGVSLSPSSLTATLTDLRANVLATERVTLETHSPTEVVRTITSVVARLPQPQPLSCLGITLGGSSRDGRTVEEASFYGWREVPLARMVEDALSLPTVLGNDLAALTQLEAWFGAGLEVDRFCLVTVGSGVGYGLVVDGEVVTPTDSEQGLMGMVPVPDGARPPVSSPAMDCLTNRSLERAWQERGREPLSAAGISLLAREGEPCAVGMCASFARRLGRFLGMSAAFTLPERVVIAGERADVAALLEDQVMVGVSAVRRASARPLDLVVREHDRAQWARAAAVLALRARVAGRL